MFYRWKLFSTVLWYTLSVASSLAIVQNAVDQGTNGFNRENTGLVVFTENKETALNINLGTTLDTVKNEGQICLIN